MTWYDLNANKSSSGRNDKQMGYHESIDSLKETVPLPADARQAPGELF